MNRLRKYIPFPERLAAALSRLLPQEQERELRAAKVSAKSVIALFHNDHIVLHALDGSDNWWNLDPKIIAVHKEKSRRDTSVVAKVKRIDKESERWRGLVGPKQRRLERGGKKCRGLKLRSAKRWPPRGSRKIQNGARKT